MAKVRNNIVINGVSGTLGDQIVFRHLQDGRTILALKPTFSDNREFSEAQKQQQDDFREAAAYAKVAQKEAVYAEKAGIKGSHPFNVAVADWFHAPEIREIDLSAWNGEAGKLIRIKAFDDVQVKQVSVVIASEADALLEQGPATQADGLWWHYTTTAAAGGNPKVIVSVEDLPGHIAKMTKSK